MDSYSFVDKDKSDYNPVVGDVYVDHCTTGQLMIWDGTCWVACDPTPIIRRHQIMKDLEEDPELMNDVIVELRKRKIEKFRK